MGQVCPIILITVCILQHAYSYTDQDTVDLEDMKRAMPGVMRFGKRALPSAIKFGKKDMPGVMRFGKREMPGVMRFGKRGDDSAAEEYAQFYPFDDEGVEKKAMPTVMRFGKKSMPGVMRFGKRNYGEVEKLDDYIRNMENMKRDPPGPAPLRFG